MFSTFTHVMNPYVTQTGQTVSLGNQRSNKMGKRGFPQHSKAKPEHESDTDVSLPDPRKRKRRVRTQAIN